MKPILIDIGGLSIYAFGVFMAAAYLLAMAWGMREAGRKGLDRGMVLEFGFYVLIAGLAGSRLFYFLLYPGEFEGSLIRVLTFWDGGLVLIGGGITGAVALMFYLSLKKQDIRAWLDALAPATALGLVVGWMGCMFAGCGYGRPSQVPWAVTYTHPDSLGPLFVSLHPAQLYHALASLVIFIVLLGLRGRLKSKGQVAGLFLMLYAVSTMAVDFFRYEYEAMLWIFSPVQAVSMVLLVVGLALFVHKKA
ncbi:prolipoprotein diacylglyceryl transferase [Desulfonatronospira thiodismutans ASO3-1]|uniref:Phosphatidylglycerol--prolipoprotein diacylglyceryl transferase n=1 Tax=Desulfonatronospira thiodismutans ASO3-1 TaxID=555779 RepID=D6SPG0_9BACT|nr:MULTISPECIES: prolipoprotein diacylglyceryl transferase family protein [Desulfonatronospira]EFI34636.1 prolipoprotein diacylglyceryl transferase [Desulfonatronospira thiodismutans ASO3-1]RQD76802.1 MAG: prolipoprotein diacylglyceryl transferase [Desulfonatronospira sp. MSAO_Bac3]